MFRCFCILMGQREKVQVPSQDIYNINRKESLAVFQRVSCEIAIQKASTTTKHCKFAFCVKFQYVPLKLFFLHGFFCLQSVQLHTPYEALICRPATCCLMES
ncbi:hypothetical protein BDL97_14G070500 [Sphagnum fallax]|nr:hypothetical protein BDL97_14G070500 [Sphagnum fallax]